MEKILGIVIGSFLGVLFFYTICLPLLDKIFKK